MGDGIPHGTRSGYSWHKCRCEVCKAYKKQCDRAYYESNRDKIKERSRQWYADNTDRFRERQDAYDARNAEHLAKKTTEYRERTRHEAVARARRWSKQPNGKLSSRLQAHRRRQQKFDKTARDYVSLLLNDFCSYCGDAPANTVDHIVPVSKGGTSEWQNLTGACRSCNSRKSDRSLLFFLLERRSA